MDNENLVSIIVPVYNVEKYLEDCIQSLVNQTYKNIEILLLNDGSTDNSSAICEKWAKIDNRIRFINKKHTGLSDTRNYGIKKSNGKWISFIDSDDLVHFQFIEILLNTAVKSNADITTNSIQKYENIDEIKNVKTYKLPKVKTYTGKKFLYKFMKTGNLKYIVVWNKLYKRELFDNISFPVGYIHEDEFVIHKLYYKAKKVSEVNLPLSFYRINRKGSIMNTLDIEASHKLFNLIFEDRIKCFKEWNLNKKYFLNNSYGRYYLFMRSYKYNVKINKKDFDVVYNDFFSYQRYFIFLKLTRILKIIMYTHKMKKFFNEE